MTFRKTRVVALLVFVAGAGGAEADSVDLGDIFHLHGYGTLGVAHSNNDQADYVTSWITQPKGAGATSSWSPNVDSKLALQLDADFTSRLSAVVQVISENLDNNSWTGSINPPYRPSVDWANVKYKVTDDFAVRVGRTLLPFGMMAEYRDIGYSLPFVRVPIEVYGSIPFTSSDGVDLSWKQHFGKKTNVVAAYGGVQTLRANAGSTQSRLYGLTDTLELGSLTLRAAYMYSLIKSVNNIAAFEAFENAAAALPNGEGAAAAAQAQWLDHIYNPGHWGSIENYDLGAMYDLKSWFAMAEYSSHQSDHIFGRVADGFVAAGYHFGQFAPYLEYSRVKTRQDSQTLVSLTGLPPGLVQLGSTVNTLVTGFETGSRSQQSISAGLRWDFASNVDAKIQWDYVELDKGSEGDFTNIQPGFRLGSNITVLSATIDFVF